MTIKFIYQSILLALIACCITAIMAITIHSMQDMIDFVSAYVSRVRIPMP